MDMIFLVYFENLLTDIIYNELFNYLSLCRLDLLDRNVCNVKSLRNIFLSFNLVELVKKLTIIKSLVNSLGQCCN